MAGSGADQSEPTLSPQGAGYQVTFRGRPLYSSKDPVAGAERRAHAVEPESRTLYLVPSPLLGYGLEALRSRLPSDSHILAVELDASLAALSRNSLPAAILSDPGISTLLAPTTAQVEAALRAFPTRRFRRVRVVTLSGGYALDSKRYRAVADYADKEIQRQWQNVLTEVKLGRRWVRNLLRNLPLLATGTDAADLRVDTPIVVAGAGPSLEASLADLRRLRRGITILAVDTAAAPLIRAGVPPDFVISLDGQWANLQDFIGVQADEYALIAELATFPGAARRSPAMFSTEFAPLRLFERLGRAGLRPLTLPPRGSVGVTAVELALCMTGRQVFVCGLDLSFDVVKTHAAGSTIPRWHHRSCHRLDPLPTWKLSHRHGILPRTDKSGDSTATTAVLLSYASQLREIAANEAAHGRLYDLSRSGLDLGIPWVDVDSLEAAVDDATRTARDRVPVADSPHATGGPLPASELLSDGGAADVREALRRFLLHELDLLERLDALVRHHVQEPAAAANGEREELLELITECDYVWLHFPDEASTEPHFLARLLPAIAEYRALVLAVRSHLSGDRA